MYMNPMLTALSQQRQLSYDNQAYDTLFTVRF